MKDLLFTAALALLASTASAQEAAGSFRTRLLTAAFTPADGPNAGDGAANAVISGRKIRIEGRFTGLSSPVTRVQVRTGLEVGVPGGTVVAVLPLAGSGAAACGPRNKIFQCGFRRREGLGGQTAGDGRIQ